MTDSTATRDQQKLFFALCADLGLDKDHMKERAKQKFNLESFSKISREQISELIDLLKERHQANDVHVHRFVCECGLCLVTEK